MITARRKGGRKTGDLSSTLAEELNSKTAFTIPAFGGIPIAECVVVTWVIMAVLVILSLILVRNLSVENPGKKQLLLETGVSFLQDFFMAYSKKVQKNSFRLHEMDINRGYHR